MSAKLHSILPQGEGHVIKLRSEDPGRPRQNKPSKKGKGNLCKICGRTHVPSGEKYNVLVIRKILEDYRLPAVIGKYFGTKDGGFVADLVSYSIISENDAAQYSAYAYNHVLFTERMYVYSDIRMPGFLVSVTDGQRIGLVNGWNKSRDHREKIYISYDISGAWPSKG